MFKSKKSTSTEKEIASLLLPHKPKESIRTPLRLEMQFTFPYRKTERKANLGKAIACDKRPDIDNIAKGYIDQMTKLGFFVDDSQIVELHIAKYWFRLSGLAVRITSLQSSEKCPPLFGVGEGD